MENCIHLVAAKCFITKNFLCLSHILVQPFVMIEGSDSREYIKTKLYINICKDVWAEDRMKMKIEIQVNRNFPVIFHDKLTLLATITITTTTFSRDISHNRIPYCSPLFFSSFLCMYIYIFLIAAVCNNNNFNKSYRNLPLLLCARSLCAITYHVRGMMCAKELVSMCIWKSPLALS